MYYGNSFNCGRIRTGRAVLVAISIPIFTTQLEKSRDAVTIANLRSAYAEAASQALTADNPNEAVTINGVKAEGTQDGWAGNINKDLPFKLGNGIDDMAKTPGTYNVTFTWGTDNKCEATAAKATGNASN